MEISMDDVMITKTAKQQYVSTLTVMTEKLISQYEVKLIRDEYFYLDADSVLSARIDLLVNSEPTRVLCEFCGIDWVVRPDYQQ
jgi:hypothetical protein